MEEMTVNNTVKMSKLEEESLSVGLIKILLLRKEVCKKEHSAETLLALQEAVRKEFFAAKRNGSNPINAVEQAFYCERVQMEFPGNKSDVIVQAVEIATNYLRNKGRKQQ